MDIGLRLAVVLALVAANGFFVAAEFALVTARKTRIEQMAARGSGAAAAVRRALDDPNRFISACQLGITMASLALGWVGEETIAETVEPLLAAVLPTGLAGVTAHGIALMVAFVAITFLHITLGEQVPKMLALQRAEASAVLTVGVTTAIGRIFYPFIALLYAFTDLVLRVFGMRWQADLHQSYTVEDLKMILESSRAAGSMGQDPERLVERALDFARLAAHHVMVPRTEMAAVPVTITLDRLVEIMRRHQHSRYPVYDGTPDNIVGVFWAKYLAAELAINDRPVDEPFNIRKHMEIPLFLPETVRADKLLAEMKLHRKHLAIVVDEYGATAGLVTLRDLLDRIAGEVPDATELGTPSVAWQPDGSAVIDGLTLLPDVEAEIGVPFVDAEFDTLGGYIFGRLGRRPVLGDVVTMGDRVFTVEELDGLRVSRVRVRARAEATASGEHGPGENGVSRSSLL